MTPLKRLAAPALAVLVVASACGRGGSPAPATFDLDGQRIMLFPVLGTDPPELDAELAYWLQDRGPAVDWVLPEDLQRAVDRAPAWRVTLSDLPRVVVGPRDAPRLVDPTYGEVRRIGAMVDALLALLPVEVREIEVDGSPGLELMAAFVDIRGGQVLWMTTVRGMAEHGAPGAAARNVAEALARGLMPRRDEG